MGEANKQRNKNERIERSVYICLSVLYAVMCIAMAVALCL